MTTTLSSSSSSEDRPKRKAKTAGRYEGGYVDFGEDLNDEEWDAISALGAATDTEGSGGGGLRDKIGALDTGLTSQRGRHYEVWEDGDYGDDYDDGAPVAADSRYKGIGGHKTTWGGAPAKSTAPAWRYGKGGKSAAGGGSTWSYGSFYGSSYNYSGYASRSYSGWYSGYSSAASAMRGVHRSASSFVRDPKYKTLSIYPSTSESVGSKDEREKSSHNGTNAREQAANSGLHLRIDASLYTRLGIEKAQQHYTIDCISQALALQRMASSVIPFELQNLLEFPLPRLIREVITEIVRRRGLTLLAGEMPGWSDRVENFKRAMIFSPEHDNSTKPNDLSEVAWMQLGRYKCLMHMAWMPNTPAGVDPVGAAKVINRIEQILDDPERAKAPSTAVKEITCEITSFVTNSVGVGALAVRLEKMLDVLDLEYARLNPCFPEPPVNDDSRDEILSGFTFLRQNLDQHFMVESDPNLVLPDQTDWKDAADSDEVEPFAARMAALGPYRRAVDLAAISALRAVGPAVDVTGRNPEPVFEEIDRLGVELHVARTEQAQLDRECDELRVRYEKLLCEELWASTPCGIRSNIPAYRFQDTTHLSISWVHASNVEETPDEKLSLPTPKQQYRDPSTSYVSSLDDEGYEKLLEMNKELDTIRSEYRDKTRALLEKAKHGDRIDTKIANAVETMAKNGHQLHLRYASGGIFDAHSRLTELLKRLTDEGGAIASSELNSLFPERPGEESNGEGGGESDEVLTVSDASNCKPSRDKDKRNKAFAHNHGDLVVDADVCAQDLPQLTGAGDPGVTPDIVVFEAMDHNLTSGRLS